MDLKHICLGALTLSLVFSANGQSCVSPPAGLISWWPAETNAFDVVSTNNGILGVGVTYAAGKVGQAFQFAGTNSVKIPASSNLNVGAGSGLTVECWVNPLDPGLSSPIAEWNNGTNVAAHFWVGNFGGAGAMLLNLIEPGGLQHSLQSAAGIVQSNTFQHIAFTYDKVSGIARLFYNGAVVAQNSPGSFTPNTAWDLHFGARPAGIGKTGFKGLIDEPSVYNRALGTNEIAAIYAAGSSGKCSGGTLPVGILAGPITNVMNGHVYYLLGPSPWTTAEAAAVQLGGHLVTMNDAAENDWVSINFSTFGGTNRHLWIGLNDVAQEGTFVWTSGEPVNYTAWYPGEPNNIPDSDYVHIFALDQISSRTWNDDTDIAFDASNRPLCGVVEIVPPNAISVISGPTTNFLTGSIYYLLSAGTWTDAETRARQLGGHLTAVNDAAENDWISTNFSTFAGTNRHLWIGLNDVAQEGSFVWTNGQPVAYTNWNTAQPDNTPESDYVHMIALDVVPTRSWNDGPNIAYDGGGRPFSGVVELVSTNLPIIIAGPLTNFGSIYYLLSPSTWTDAELKSVQLGGHLITVNDGAENDWMSAKFSTFGGTNRHLWIGLNDVVQEGTFVWVSGEPVNYTAWNPGEPNNIPDTDYVHMFALDQISARTWNDDSNIAFDGSGRPIDGVVEIKSTSAPIIVEQPTNQTVIVNLPATFSVNVFGATPLGYQWFWNGTNIDNATNSIYSIASAQFSQAGFYSVRITNVQGSVLSSNALLTVLPPPPVPAIFSFSPSKARAGEPVQLIGTNLNAVPASNLVYFGAVQASVLAASLTNLTVVTPVGATFAPPSVTITGLTAQAGLPFQPTYPGTGVVTSTSFATKVDFTATTGQASVAVGDLDGDGKPDLVAANNNNSSVSVYRNVSSNGMITASSFATRITFSTGSVPYVSLADVDGDGKLDILAANSGGSTVSILRNTSTPGILTNNSFAAAVNFTVGSSPTKVTAADLDGDGKLDLAVANSNSGTISLLRNLSSPGIINASSFAARVDIATGTNVRDVEAADLDGDGKLDLAVANFTSTNVTILRNIGTYGLLTTNSFAPRVTLGTGSAYNIAIGDLDGDGRPDLVVDNRPASIAVIRNLSTPGTLTSNSFAAKVSIPTTGEPYQVAIGDIDGDGKPDLAASLLTSNSIAVLHNLSSPGILNSNSFSSNQTFATATAPRTVVLADLDADGRPDLIVANLSSSVVSVLKNLVPTVPLPGFITQPANQSVILDDPVTFSVTASNTLAYQWRFNGGDINGQTNSTLALLASQLGSSGSYSVMISNLYGSAVSTNALLVVTVPDCTPAPAGIVGWWSGNGDGHDSAGVNNSVVQFGVGFAAGKAGQAFQLGATNDGVRIPASPALDVGTGNGFTLECWVKLATVIGNNPLLEWNDGSEGTGSLWGVHLHVGPFGPGTLYANVMGPGGSWHQVYSAQDVVKSNTFVHVALTYDKPAGLARLFCNGTVVSEQSIGSFTPVTDTDLYIGKRPSGGFIANSVGLMDEVSVYNRALGTNEIAAIYAARGAGKCPIATPVNPTPTNIVSSLTGNTLTLTWPSDHIGWTLQTQTNALGTGLNPTNSWFNVAGSVTTNSVSITINPTEPTVFYRLVYP